MDFKYFHLDVLKSMYLKETFKKTVELKGPDGWDSNIKF